MAFLQWYLNQSGLQFSVTFFFKSAQMQRLLISTLFFLKVEVSFSQQFGGNPPAIKWKQLNSDTARVIFPEGLDTPAQKVASIVHYLAANNHTLGTQKDKINIVLQNQTTIANGYAGLGPFRSEFMMTPSMNNFELGSIVWASSLALHEYRHVQQFSNFRVGLSKTMRWLFGQEGLALAINAAIPDWFYEGDAVYNETVHTEQGRGRIPLFVNEFKSLWLAGKKYSWMKLRNGSLKDYIPGHYPLGYLLVNYGYEKYGSDFWKKVTRDAASYKGLVYPFQKAIQRQTGEDYQAFRDAAFEYYQQSIRNQVDKRDNSGERISGNSKNFVSNYYYPYSEGDTLVYLKSSYRKLPAFTVKDNSGEHSIRIRDISLDEQFSYRNGNIVYAAYKPDIRWGWKDFSEIRLLNVFTGQQKTVTHRSKYFAPDISPDGQSIVAVYYDPSAKCELHLLQASNGNIKKKISSPEAHVFTEPKFLDENNLVAVVRFRNGQMSLVKINCNTGILEKITPPSFHVIGFVNVAQGSVYFTASLSGNDEVFVHELSSGKTFQLTQSQTGKYFAGVNNDKLVTSSFTADGYQLNKLDMPSKNKREINDLNWHDTIKIIPVARTEEYSQMLLNKIPQRSFESGRYKKGTRLLNFHSWRPNYADPEFSFTVYGQNILNTLQTEVFYLYNQDEKTNSIGFGSTFGALFPYISAGAEYTIHRTQFINNMEREWNQLDTRIGLSFPFNFSGGRFFRYLNSGSQYVLRNEFNTGPAKNNFEENNFSYLSHFINYNQQVQMARQHIYPRFGYQFSLQQRHAITRYSGCQFYSSANLYLPGFFTTHSLVLNAAFQQRDTLRQLFSNRFPYSRGYNELYFSRMWKWGVNYHFPVCLPDWGFANILYIRRLRGNAFYDFTKVYSRNKKITRDQRSAGLEIYFDTQWWNQYPLSFGFRAGRLLDNDLQTGKQGGFFEFIVPVIIPK
jgi:hypothetical protein